MPIEHVGPSTIQNATTNVRKRERGPRDFGSRLLSGGIVRPGELDTVFDATLARSHVFIQRQRTPPHEWRTRQRLSESQVSTLHTPGQIDLGLTGQQTH